MSKILERFKNLETPFYFYDTDVLHRTLKEVKRCIDKYGIRVHYALKANVNEKLLSIISGYDLGADCVSGNEIKAALMHGFSSDKIAFAGVGKTDNEINYALNENIACINVESLQELSVVNEFAALKNKKAPVAIRINPNLDAKTHKNITTGREENKFGIAEENFPLLFEQLKSLRNIDFQGLHFHIGSQIVSMDVFEGLAKKVNEIHKEFRVNGLVIKHLNVGGGFGVDYDDESEDNLPDFDSYFSTFMNNLELQPGQEVHFELGRSIVAAAGKLISRVLFVKPGKDTSFVIVDAGMTELIRPALYSANHRIKNLSSNNGKEVYDVVGPICETSDWFGKKIELPYTQRGDLLAILKTGAYGEVMSSGYNLRPKAKAYYSDEIL